MRLEQVAAIVDGALLDADPAAMVTGGVEFDSRKIGPGGVFVAFAGEHVDGHDYVRGALQAGAVACIVTRPVDGPRVEVADALAAITALARYVARQLSATVVAITGSSGKTSTKDLAAHVLGELGQTVAPPGSFNNELGHPYTVLLADENTTFLILETSARGIGHIRHLAEVAPPHIAVVLNVGSAHLGEFGSRDAIAQAKGELVEALTPNDVAMLNADDPLVLAMRSRTSGRIVTFGTGPNVDVRAENILSDEFDRARFQLVSAGANAEVALRLVGEHQVSNALAVAAVALECGMSLDAIAAALSSATAASRWRMELTERADGVLVINDAYNANPESMRAALKALAALAAARRSDGGRSFAVLGPMAELGAESQAEHDALGRLAVRLDITRVIAVGEPARPIAHGAALEGSWDGESSWVPDVESAVALLRSELRSGDVVLVKASRAASLERVALAVTDDSSSDVPTKQAGGDQA